MLESSKLGLSDEEGEQSEFKKFLEFQREAYIMSLLNHSKLVELVALCTRPLGMIMELLPRGDLYHNLYATEKDPPGFQAAAEKLKSSWTLRLHVAMDIAKGMRHLHSLSPPVIHRDLRSPNIFVRLFCTLCFYIMATVIDCK